MGQVRFLTAPGGLATLFSQGKVAMDAACCCACKIEIIAHLNWSGAEHPDYNLYLAVEEWAGISGGNVCYRVANWPHMSIGTQGLGYLKLNRDVWPDCCLKCVLAGSGEWEWVPNDDFGPLHPGWTYEDCVAAGPPERIEGWAAIAKDANAFGVPSQLTLRVWWAKSGWSQFCSRCGEGDDPHEKLLWIKNVSQGPICVDGSREINPGTTEGVLEDFEQGDDDPNYSGGSTVTINCGPCELPAKFVSMAARSPDTLLLPTSARTLASPVSVPLPHPACDLCAFLIPDGCSRLPPAQRAAATAGLRQCPNHKWP